MGKKQIGEAGEWNKESLTRASTSTNFNPSFLRYFRYTWEMNCILRMGLFALVLGFGLMWLATRLQGGGAIVCWVIGIPATLLGLAVLGGIVFLWGRIRQGYANGLLTAAVVDSVKPPSILCIAVLSSGGAAEKYIYGIKRENYGKFPKAFCREGQQLACVSTFSDDIPHAGSWNYFNPTPVVFGTGDERKVQHCLGSVMVDTEGDGNYFEILQRFLSRYSVPKDFEDYYVCNAEGEYLETRQTKARTENPKVPPPLPPQAKS